MHELFSSVTGGVRRIGRAFLLTPRVVDVPTPKQIPCQLRVIRKYRLFSALLKNGAGDFRV
jgi:hypothetical protein